MWSSIFMLFIAVLLVGNTVVLADRPGEPVVELTSGQWVEVRDMDPVPSRRDIRHLWLHRGSLLFGVARIDGKPPFRDAVTYFGLPIRLLAQKRRGGWHIKEIDNSIRSSFHLTRNVFCPGESNPILLQGQCLRGGAPIGEGYVFDLRTVDADGDGVADQLNGQDYFEAVVQLDRMTAAELDVNDRFVFNIYQKDLDRYEDDGVLFRLDRPHPQHEVRFLGMAYQPCGSTRSSEIRKATALKAYAEAEGKAGFNFWGWLTASLTVGAQASRSTEDTESFTITTTTTGGTTFRQWGLIFDYTLDADVPEHQTPFFIEKVFECASDVGEASFGDRIKRVEIGVLDHFTGNNTEFEFNRPEDFQTFDARILDKLDKPVFISINESEAQARALEVIKTQYGVKDHYLAAFVFSQLNLACPEDSRAECLGFLAERRGRMTSAVPMERPDTR